MERVNRPIRRHLNFLGKMSFGRTDRESKKAVKYINEVRKRKILGGMTSREAYARGVFYKKSDRPLLIKKVTEELRKINLTERRRRDNLAAMRRAVVKAFVAFELAHLNHWSEPLEKTQANMKNIIRKYEMTVEASKILNIYPVWTRF